MNTTSNTHPSHIVEVSDTSPASARSQRDCARPLPNRRRRLRWLVTATALAFGGVPLVSANVAEASVRGPDGTVYQVTAGCDPFLDTIDLQLTPNWGNKPLTTFKVWSINERRFIGSGAVSTFNSLRFPYGTKGSFKVQVTYTWIYNNLTTWSHTEWLPSYTIKSIYGAGYPSSVCYL